MKRKFTFLIAAAMMLLTMVAQPITVWADSETITFSELGLENGVQYTDPFGTNISVTFAGGANDGKYYTTGSGIRTYGNGTITITALGNTVTAIATTFAGNSYAPAAESVWTCTGGSGTGTSGVNASWSGSATEIVMTRPSGSGHWRLQSITVTYTTGGGSDPSISANDVNIAYDATEGSIAYTINNPVDGGAVTSATITDSDPNGWLTVNGSNPYTSPISLSCEANSTPTERTATVQLTYTYNNTKETVNKDVTVTQAGDPNYIYTTIPEIFAVATGTETNVNVTFGNWVVSGVSGSNAYVTDNIGNGFIIYKSEHGFAVNDKLSGTVTGTPLKLYSGSAEFTNLTTSTTGLSVSDDGEITVITNKTIAELGGVNTGAVITLNGLTYDGTNLSDGTSSIKPYNSLYSSMIFTSGKTYNVTGVYLQYNSTKEIMPRSAADIVLAPAVETPTFSPAEGTYTSVQNVTLACATEGATIYYTTNGSTPTTSSTQYNGAIEVSTNTTIKAIAVKAGMNNSAIATAAYTINLPVPTITVEPANVDVIAAGDESTLTATYTNMGNVEDILADIAFYEADGTTPATYNWITANIKNDDNTVVEYLALENEGAARTAYFKVYGTTDGENFIYSNLVTISQDAPDYATLPFAWAGGTKEEIAEVPGVTTNGLGSNYAEGNAPYRIKMDGVGDFIKIKTGSKPGMVTIDVKMLGGATTSKIKVQESIDGSEFTDVEELTISGKQNDILTLTTSNSFAATTRYVKIIKSLHATGGNIGVGPITIDITGSQTVTDYTIPANNTITIGNGSVLTITGTLTNNGDASNLVIEDGGQLIYNGIVQATMKKSTAHAGAKAVGDWYTIASPLAADVAAADVVNFINATATNYDFYRYDEASRTWENSKTDGAGFTDLTVGRGYLYWNADGVDLEFAGTLRNDAVPYTLNASGTGTFKGFNLIGNPFSQNITMSNISGATLAGGYVLTHAGGWSADVETTIAPCQGFLVKVDETTNITISKGAKSREHREYIKFIVANSQYEDAAFALFDDATGLDKINHRNASIPMLYIAQNEENYAIATMSEETQSFNLNFKAMTTGQYTLSYKAEGNYDYLHVIDRLTGEDVDMLLDGEYSFIASPSDNDARFIVKLGYNANGNAENDIFAYQDGSDIVVNGEGELQVFDMMGRMIATQHINGVQTVNMPSNGVYIFKLNEKTQKIVVR